MKLSFNKLVKNKYLLYLLALISFVVIINNMLKQKFAAILFFYLICVITFNYSKNMNIKNQYDVNPDAIVRITFLEKNPTIIAVRAP